MSRHETPAATMIQDKRTTRRPPGWTTHLSNGTECVSPTFSADGNQLAFVSDMAGVPQVWVHDLHSGALRAVTSKSDQAEQVEWEPDGPHLAYSCWPTDGPNMHVYVAQTDGTAQRCMTPPGAATSHLGGWHPRGARLFLAANPRSPESMDACSVDVATGAVDIMVPTEGLGMLTDADPGGRFQAAFVSRGPSRRGVLLVDTRTRHATTVLPSMDKDDLVGGGHFSHDGRRLYVVTNYRRDFMAFAAITLKGGTAFDCVTLRARDDADLESFVVSRDRTTALLSWNLCGRSQLEVVDLLDGTRRATLDPPEEVLWGASFSPCGRRVALSLTGASSPPNIWLLDLASARFARVTTVGQAAHARLVHPTLIRFSALDGLDLTAWLYRPSSQRDRVPCVLSFHGGPASQESPSFTPLYQALLRRGIAVLAPNVRGSTGFGKRFAALDDRELRADARKDVLACARSVVASGVADPQRLGIMGESYGGYLALCGLVDYPELFRAGATISGISNLVTYLERTEPWRRPLLEAEFGCLREDRDLLVALSPMSLIDRLVAPLLVIHGARDISVPATEADQLVRELRRRQVTVRYRLFADEGHGFGRPANRQAVETAVVRWFTRYMGTARGPLPGRPLSRGPVGS